MLACGGGDGGGTTPIAVPVPTPTPGTIATATGTLTTSTTSPTSVTISANVGSLPVAATMCQTNANGQCLAPPTQTLPASFAGGATATYSVILTASAAIATPGTLTMDFTQGTTVIGSGSVLVNTN
jgi:hypothetical protein